MWEIKGRSVWTYFSNGSFTFTMKAHCINPLEQWGGGESDETSRIFCGHVSFPEMNGEKGVYGGQSQIIIKKGG